MGELTVFNNLFEEQSVEIIRVDDNFLFNAQQVAECLEIKNIRKTMTNFKDKHKKILNNSDVTNGYFRKLNNRGETFLTEQGLYKLIFNSRVKKAEEFQDWVFDVLKEIRQKGYYVDANITSDQLEDLEETVDHLKQLEAFTKRDGMFTIGQVAKRLGLKSAKQLIAILLEVGILESKTRLVTSNEVYMLVKKGMIQHQIHNYGNIPQENIKFDETGIKFLESYLESMGKINQRIC